MKVESRWRIMLLSTLLSMQLLLSLASPYALDQIVRAVFLSMDRPTPTCPTGVYTYTSQEVFGQCAVERIHTYAPQWVMPVARITVPGNFIWLLTSIALRRTWKKTGAIKKQWDFWLQAGLFGIALVLYSLIISWPLLIKLVIFGADAFR